MRLTMCPKGRSVASRGIEVLAVPLLCGLALVMMINATGCVPRDDSHPPETLSGSETIEETDSPDGTASKTVTSRWTAPDQNFNLNVTVTSPLSLAADEVQVRVTLTCQFGNTKTFDVTLAPGGSGGLVGDFSRAANASDGSECIGVTGQKEAAKWAIQFIRPSQTTQALTFSYTMNYRLASIETP